MVFITLCKEEKTDLLRGHLQAASTRLWRALIKYACLSRGEDHAEHLEYLATVRTLGRIWLGDGVRSSRRWFMRALLHGGTVVVGSIGNNIRTFALLSPGAYQVPIPCVTNQWTVRQYNGRKSSRTW